MGLEHVSEQAADRFLVVDDQDALEIEKGLLVGSIEEQCHGCRGSICPDSESSPIVVRRCALKNCRTVCTFYATNFRISAGLQLVVRRSMNPKAPLKSHDTGGFLVFIISPHRCSVFCHLHTMAEWAYSFWQDATTLYVHPEWIRCRRRTREAVQCLRQGDFIAL